MTPCSTPSCQNPATHKVYTGVNYLMTCASCAALHEKEGKETVELWVEVKQKRKTVKTNL